MEAVKIFGAMASSRAIDGINFDRPATGLLLYYIHQKVRIPIHRKSVSFLSGRRLRDFAVDLPAVLFLLFDTLQRLVLYFLYTRALKSRRDLRTKTDVWYVCVSRILRTIIVAVSETVAIILLLCGLGRRLPMHVVVLVVAVMAAPLPKDALPCVRTLTSWVSSLNQSSDSTSAITTIHSETSTVTIIEDHQTLESLVEQLEAAAKKFKQAQKASGMRVEVFGTPAEPAMPGHGLSIKRSVTRELEVVEVAVDYTNALLELAQLLKMSTPGDMESVVHSKLAYFIAILKSEMLLHVHNFMLSDQSIHEPNLLVTMATCIGCLDVYAELADPSLRDCFGAIILVLEQARLALDQYRSDIAGMMRNLYMFHPSSQAVIGISSRPATALT